MRPANSAVSARRIENTQTSTLRANSSNSSAGRPSASDRRPSSAQSRHALHRANVPKTKPKNPATRTIKKQTPSKPRLRLAPKPRRFRKLFIASITLGLLGLVAIPFVIVFIHAALLTGQRDLDHRRQDLNEQLELRQQLLFERSLAVSPQRIITIARDRLGMVSAEKIVYLQSASLSAPSPAQPSTIVSVPQPTS